MSKKSSHTEKIVFQLLHFNFLALLIFNNLLFFLKKNLMKKKTIVCIVVEQKYQKRLRVAKNTRSHQKRIFPINKSPRLLQ